MAKLFSVKLANLETEIEDLKLNTSSSSSTRLTQTESKLKDLESRVNELATQQAALRARVNDADNKLNQMVDELTTILNQHATAIKELTKIKT